MISSFLRKVAFSLIPPGLCWAGHLGTHAAATLLAQDLASPEAVCVAALPQRLASRFETAALETATLSIAVETLSGQSIYHHQSGQRMIPASTQKLLTTAAALHHWSSDRSWRTPLYLTNSATGEPELWIVGQGDPSLTPAGMETLATQVAQALQSQGINRLQRIVGDDRYLGGTTVPPTWEIADTQAGYGAPINSLIFNDNAIPLTLWPQSVGEPLRVEWEDPRDREDWRLENWSQSGAPQSREFVVVGHGETPDTLRIEGVLQSGAPPEPVAVASSHPGQRFLRRFAAALAEQGIQSDRWVRLDLASSEQPESPQLLLNWTSPTLAELLTVIHHQSQNLYAEVLLRWLGKTQPNPAPLGRPPSTLEDGLMVLRQTLENLGLDTRDLTLADASGLSRHNALTAAALVDLLQVAAQSPWGETYRQSLPVAGQSGSLKRRFEQTPVAGRLWAKTGSMSGVSALAGYLYPQRFSPLAVSLIINQSPASYGALTQVIDELVLTLVALEDCGLD